MNNELRGVEEQKGDTLFQCSFRRKKKNQIKIGILKAGLSIAVSAMTMFMAGCNTVAEMRTSVPEATTSITQTILTDNQQALKTTLYKLQAAIDANELDADFMTHLRETCDYLHELEEDINKDNAQAIKELAMQAETSINKIDTSALTDEGKTLVSDIHDTVKRIKKKADKVLKSSTSEGITIETTPITEEPTPTEIPTMQEETKEETKEEKVEITVKEDVPDTPIVQEETSETGGYTAGGYAPITPNEKYMYNGIEYWNNHMGTIFRENESKDLHNWVTAGYTRWRTVDNRIASRKGGVDNPRIAEFLSLEIDDNRYVVPDYTYNLVTVMKGDYNVSKDSKEFKEFKEVVEGHPGCASLYTKGRCEGSKVFGEYLAKNGSKLEKLFNLNAEEHGEDYAAMTNTRLDYNCRNYCGDFIYMTIDGYGTVKSLNDGQTALAGKDYILTCKSDPDAFKLIKGKELENYYEVYNVADTNGNMYIERADFFNRMGGMSFGDCAVYMGVKPGIYDCKVTIPSTGDTFDITIENLPISYSEFRWGCSSHEEMDTCVAFMQGCEYGVFNQYYGEQAGQSPKNYPEISLPISTEKEKLKAVDEFNSFKYKTYDGDKIQLKSTAEAAEWVCHLPGVKAPMYFDDDSELQIISGVRGHAVVSNQNFEDYTAPSACTSYNALRGILYGAGDCESTSATMTCMYNVLGYTTRYITGGRHAWFEVKVPASITKSGKDQWMMVDGGIITATPTKDMVRTTVYKEQKGYDNSWWTLCKDGISRKETYAILGFPDAYKGYER